MNRAPTWLSQVLELSDAGAQQRLFGEHVRDLDATIAPALKQEADRQLRADVQRSLQVAGLIGHVAALRHDDCDRALGLLAEANARAIGLAEYERAIHLYDEATALYHRSGTHVDEAKAQVGKVGALAFLGRYAEAVQCWQWASPILQEHGQWQPLATMTMNLAIMFARKGEDSTALEFFNRAASLYRQLGDAGRAGWLWVQHNRAWVLRNLGQFEESIAACQVAQQGLLELGQPTEAARAQQILALTYFVMGRYNEALKNLDQVRNVFAADGRQRDALLVDLFTSNCLLQLRRFAEVLETCRKVRSAFFSLGAHDVAAKAILNEGVAYAGLGAYDQALRSLEEARCMFAEIGNQPWMASAELETAAVLRLHGDAAGSLGTAQRCEQVFGALDLPVEQAQACLVAARAAIALNQEEDSRVWIQRALAISANKDVASLLFQGHHLMGTLAARRGELTEARQSLQQAIEQLERLRGRLMVEFRADFLEDKQAVYEEMVGLCLELHEPLAGLEYAERAKSRALVDMLAYRLDLGIEARDPEDLPYVEELRHLREQRDQLYRRWQGGREELKARGSETHGEGWQNIEQEVLALENRITRLWHKLLVRNADYARDAALWRVQTEPIQPYLDQDTALLEYYVIGDRLIAFAVTRQEVQALQLDATLAHVQTLHRLLRLNLEAVPRTPAQRIPKLTSNAQALLQQLNDLLIAPFAGTVGNDYRRWFIVPHGILHYLPFHAFYDGETYLLQRHLVSYLPGASLLRYCCEPRVHGQGLLALGHSYEGRLPYAVDEARSVAAITGGDAFVEAEATPQRLRELGQSYGCIHLATHGDFRPDNSLFSGLALAQQWLTTLDIFGLRLNASLVALSACQTGRSTIGGGDELLGLMRAFLHAGASSLVLSLWPVEDRSTARLMEMFYTNLVAGQSKAEALSAAQQRFISAGPDEMDPAVTTHPYFWAPFYLVGDPGQL
jgi:CHAT domain-containing protein